MSKRDPLYKILILGDSTVGKTCFLTRYADNTFQDLHTSTIGIDYKLKNVKLDDNRIIRLQIWDTAGQDRYRSLTKSYYKGANGIIIIFAVTLKSSFDNVKNWVSQIRAEADENVTIFLVGNKIDDVERREISTEEGQELADKFKVPFFECSAKTGENINTTFNELVKKIVEIGDKIGTKGGEKLRSKKDAKKKKECC